jgi:DNA excision repair protein ERCC-4
VCWGHRMDASLRVSDPEAEQHGTPLAIVADDRERIGGVIACLEKFRGVSVLVRRIEDGDFVVEGQFVVERKTLRDFAQSLVDGRLFRQASRLAQSPLRRVLVLEGTSEDLRTCNVTRDSLQGALITVGVFYGIPILRAMNAPETARLIVYLARQARRVARGAHSRPGLRPKGSRARQLYILQGLPGIGPERAARLLEKFGTIRGIVNASADELSAVDGIGEKTAGRICAVLE